MNVIGVVWDVVECKAILFLLFLLFYFFWHKRKQGESRFLGNCLPLDDCVADPPSAIDL